MARPSLSRGKRWLQVAPNCFKVEFIDFLTCSSAASRILGTCTTLVQLTKYKCFLGE